VNEDDNANGDEWTDFSESAEQVESGRLGDIAISLPQVARQAAENGKSVKRELAMLTIHGVLHLLGYDHAELDKEKVMFGKTDVVLAEIFGN
jgi:probable rRNA maturation factor